MDDKNTRVIEINDAQLRSYIIKKGKMVEQGRALAQQMEELAKQHEKLTEEMGALTNELNEHKLLIFRRVKLLAEDKLQDFEIPVTTELRDDKPVLLATDTLAEFKETFSGFDKWNEPVPRKPKAEAE